MFWLMVLMAVECFVVGCLAQARLFQMHLHGNNNKYIVNNDNYILGYFGSKFIRLIKQI